MSPQVCVTQSSYSKYKIKYYLAFKNKLCTLVPLSKAVPGMRALRGDNLSPLPSVHTQNNILILLMSWHVQPMKNPN